MRDIERRVEQRNSLRGEKSREIGKRNGEERTGEKLTSREIEQREEQRNRAER